MKAIQITRRGRTRLYRNPTITSVLRLRIAMMVIEHYIEPWSNYGGQSSFHPWGYVNSLASVLCFNDRTCDTCPEGQPAPYRSCEDCALPVYVRELMFDQLPKEVKA